jgi:phage tail sheath protein FI
MANGVAYLHGTEVLNVQLGTRPIQVVRSSVIGLVGISPKGPTNQLTLVSSEDDASAFGMEVPGFTIPQSLNAIFANRPSPVLVVNIFNPSLHTVAVALESVTIASGKAQLVSCPIGALTHFFLADGITDSTAVVNTDYTIDDFGNIVVLNNTLLPDAVYKISYITLDPTAVTNVQLIGSVTGGVRTGMKCWQTAYNAYGFKPKQLIAPGFSTDVDVCTALQIEAAYYKAMTWFDAPMGTTVADAITGRGPLGTINFNFADKRVGLMYNMPLATDKYTGADQTRWLSAFFAGVVVANDIDNGYWFSPSNKPILGITGFERTITWDIADTTGTTEANQLSAAGIVTIVNGYGTGNLTWGNSSSAFPGSTTPDQFICVQRTRDVVEESIAYAMLPFLDAPIQLPQIDSCVETVNAFIRELIGRGALIVGSQCLFDPSKNSDAELAAGHIVFTLTLMSPTPGQRITFLSSLDISLLKSLLNPSV